MDRRYFLKGLGAGAASLGLLPSTSQARSCKIICIGGGGCNFVLAAAHSGAALVSAKWKPEVVCIDLSLDKINEVDAINSAIPGVSSIKTLSLGKLGGAGGNASIARASALQQLGTLRALVADAELVLLVASLGGGTGSAVAPIIARLAREAGALTGAVVTMPFQFEGERRGRQADAAIRHLNRETDRVLLFSNEALMATIGDDVTQDVFFAVQNRRIALGISSLIDDPQFPLELKRGGNW
jgi:cell division protein FtsZ